MSVAYSSLVLREAHERLFAFQTKAEQVEKLWAVGKLKVIAVGGILRIVMNTGSAISARFMTPEQYAALTPEQTRFPQTVNMVEFLADTPVSIVDAWRAQAIAARESTLRGEIGATFSAESDGDNTRWLTAPGAAGRGRTPTHVFLVTPGRMLRGKYTRWAALDAPARAATPDPLTLPTIPSDL
jgi:hypothetical protein